MRKVLHLDADEIVPPAACPRADAIVVLGGAVQRYPRDLAHLADQFGRGPWRRGHANRPGRCRAVIAKGKDWVPARQEVIWIDCNLGAGAPQTNSSTP